MPSRSKYTQLYVIDGSSHNVKNPFDVIGIRLETSLVHVLTTACHHHVGRGHTPAQAD
jgi:cell division ATPase FtsA